MKHATWLRLQGEADKICAALRQNGYKCLKQEKRFSWRITKEGQEGEYNFSWIPAPAGEWVVLPNSESPMRKDIVRIIDSALRVVDTKHLHPWAIVRLLPNAQRYIVARFYNRQDADDHLRTLRRFMPMAEFEVVFDIPQEEVCS